MTKQQLTETKFILTFDSAEEANNFFKIAEPKNSLKAADVMKILDISRVTLCHYVKRGLITIDTNYTGGQYRYNADSVYKLKKD